MRAKLTFSPKNGQKGYIYQNDGSGRDTYISFNSGGNAAPDYRFIRYESPGRAMRAISFFTTKRETEPRITRYRSDGKGRDTYIAYDAGGLYGSHLMYSPQSPAQKFKETLRNYETSTIFKQTLPNIFLKQSKKMRTISKQFVERQSDYEKKKTLSQQQHYLKQEEYAAQSVPVSQQRNNRLLKPVFKL